MTLVVGGPSCSGLYTSWKEIPETGMSFKVSSPFGPLPLMVGGSGAGAGLGAAGAGTAGVELLELVAVGVLLSDAEEDEADDDDDVLGSGERDRLAWLVSWLAAVFLTGVPCLRVGAVAVALSFPEAGSTTLTDFLVGSAADAAAVVVDPFCWQQKMTFLAGHPDRGLSTRTEELLFTIFTAAVADIFTDFEGISGGHTNSTRHTTRSGRGANIHYCT